MRKYELTVVFHPDLEMNIDPALDKVKKIVESNGGQFTHEEVDGKKRLAYTIAKQNYGVYYYFEVDLPSNAPQKIATVLGITDEVLRHMLVKADDRKAKYEAIKAEREAKRQAAEDAETATESAEAKADEAKAEKADASEVEAEAETKAEEAKATEAEVKSEEAEAETTEAEKAEDEKVGEDTNEK